MASTRRDPWRHGFPERLPIRSPRGPSTQYLRTQVPKTMKGMVFRTSLDSRPPNVPLSRALWSLLVGIWGILKGSWGVAREASNIGYLDLVGSRTKGTCSGSTGSAGPHVGPLPSSSLFGLGLTYGPLSWTPTSFFLVWVRFEAWALDLRWYLVGK